MSNPYSLQEAKDLAAVVVRFNRPDVPMPARAVEKLVERLTELEAAQVPNGGFDAVSVYLEAWQAAREYFGTDGDEDDLTDKPLHYAECSRVQGPYECSCDDEGQSALAYGLALNYLEQEKRRR